MSSAALHELRGRLLRSGIAPRYVERTIAELQDHLDDVEREAEENGLTRAAAEALAIERIGDFESITRQYRQLPELRCWFYRYPRLARAVLPVAYVGALLTAPITSGIDNASLIGKWCACMFLSAIATASMMLLLHVSIMPG